MKPLSLEQWYQVQAFCRSHKRALVRRGCVSFAAMLNHRVKLRKFTAPKVDPSHIMEAASLAGIK